MKLRNIIISLLAVTVLAAGCNRDQIDPSYDSFSTSTNFVALPADGSAVTLEVNSTESWSIYDRLFPEDKNWENFKVEPLSGEPGKTTVTISSSETSSNRQMELCFIIGERSVIDALGEELDDVVADYDKELELALDKADEDAVKKVWDKKKKAAEQVLSSALVKAKRHYVTVKQSAGEAEVEFSTCAEIAAGTTGKVYYAKGSVTSIVNTLYGNWTLKDATGTMYIYGTLDEAGEEKNFESLGLAEGDFVEVMGPLSPYNGTPQLKNITVLKIEKGIIKLEKDVKTVEIPMTVLDETRWNITKIYSIEEDADYNEVEVAAPWVTLGPSYVKDGKVYQTLNVEDYLENKAPRVAYIKFAAEKTEGENTKVAELTYTLTQLGNVPEIKTVADATAETSGTWVRIKGIVMGLSKYGIVVADNDCKDAIFCDDITTVSIGETVEVSGYVSGNRKFFQLSNCYCEAIPADSKAEYPEQPTVVTPDLLAGVANRTIDAKLEYVKYIGTAVADGTKGDIKFAVGSYWLKPHNVHSSIYVNKAIDKNVEVYGYLYQLKDADMRFIITDLKYAETATE